MIWGYYPAPVDILPAAAAQMAAVRGMEEAALERACEEVEREGGVKLVPCRRSLPKQQIRGVFLLPEFPARNLSLTEEGGIVVIEDKYTLDKERGILLSESLEESYYVTYEVGYPDGELPGTLQLLLRVLGRFYLCGQQEDREEANWLMESWKSVVRKIREQRHAFASQVSGDESR